MSKTPTLRVGIDVSMSKNETLFSSLRGGKKILTPRALEKKRAAAKQKALHHKLVDDSDDLVRAICMLRDGNQCVICHTDKFLQSSHIFCKEIYKDMRWVVDNVEIRCAGDHFYKPGAPHADPAGFHYWLEHNLSTERFDYLHSLTLTTVKITDEWIAEQNRELRKRYLALFGYEWTGRTFGEHEARDLHLIM